MTLDEFHRLDPWAMWKALSAEQQSGIIVPLLTCAFAEVCQDDDGTDCSAHDRATAAGVVQDTYSAMWHVMKEIFIDILGDDHTALHSLSSGMIDDTSKVRVKGLRGMRTMRTDRAGEYIRIAGQKVRVDGFKNVAAPGEPAKWEAWTGAQVDAERLRRHPNQFIGPRLPDPASAVRSALSPTEPHPAIHHEDHSYDRAA